ncbi:MAG: hypothetical protein IPM69_12615 [Ignavibacteria bacterium]|nr:hypothetical protein [Ignavibacteria bacterium]
MKLSFVLRSAIIISVCCIAVSCSESTSVSDTAQVQFYTQMDVNSVTTGSIKPGNSSILKGVTADSLKISRVRILVSNLKLHLSKEDSNTSGHNVKVGPFLITIDSSGTRLNETSTIPTGNYDRVKFEFHRFSSSEVSTYLNDAVFSDFVTGDRYTIIIDGTVYNGGVATPFTYKSDVTINLSLKFDNDIQFLQNATDGIVLLLRPRIIFKSGTSVLDPRDPGNESDIDNALKSAFHCIKKMQ